MAMDSDIPTPDSCTLEEFEAFARENFGYQPEGEATDEAPERQSARMSVSSKIRWVMVGILVGTFFLPKANRPSNIESSDQKAPSARPEATPIPEQRVKTPQRGPRNPSWLTPGMVDHPVHANRFRPSSELTRDEMMKAFLMNLQGFTIKDLEASLRFPKRPSSGMLQEARLIIDGQPVTDQHFIFPAQEGPIEFRDLPSQHLQGTITPEDLEDTELFITGENGEKIPVKVRKEK